MAIDLLNRATVFDPKTHKLVNADYRVSKTAWLRDDPLVEKLNRRISIISGVDHEYAEDMQMSNYGIGGQYEPHYDFRKGLTCTQIPATKLTYSQCSDAPLRDYLKSTHGHILDQTLGVN